mmetsp:Transcript_7462/g.14909  ORF Transcript_7462/g.14909 Transcript_7462/m.14909 type:complete len:107 (+) Transcript_7462:260-580(+)
MKKVVSTSNKKDTPVVKKEKVDDYEMAEDKIFHALEDAEKKVMKAARNAEHVVEDALHEEVDSIFHKVTHAKKIVDDGDKTVEKVKRCWPENLKESMEECLAGNME